MPAEVNPIRYSQKTIAEVLGVSKSAIQHTCREIGLNSNYKGLTAEQVCVIRDYRNRPHHKRGGRRIPGTVEQLRAQLSVMS